MSYFNHNCRRLVIIFMPLIDKNLSNAKGFDDGEILGKDKALQAITKSGVNGNRRGRGLDVAFTMCASSY